MRPLALFLLLCGCAEELKIPVASTTVVGHAKGTVDVVGRVDGRQVAALLDAEVRVFLDGQPHSTRDADCETGDAKLLDCQISDGVRVTLEKQTTGGLITLQATVTSETARVVDGLELLSGKLELPASPDRLRYLHNGYQSWSFAGALDLQPGAKLERGEQAIKYLAPNGTTAFDERAGLSSHDAIIDAGEGSALVFGFVSVDRFPGAVGLEQPDETRRVVAINGFTGKGVTVDAEHPVSSEKLLVHYASTAGAAMTAYGTAIEAERGKQDDAAGFGQLGWFSWNRFFEAIDEALIFKQADELKGLGDARFDLVELDDGWQKAWGDWTPNEKFRAIDELAADMETRGQRLGLWAAPFVVESTLPVVAAHPEWWVKKSDGETLVHAPFGTPHKLMVVDTTHPEALAWAVENITALQQAGADFFKFDYLYAAALDGVRHDPQATGTSALKAGLDALLQALDTPNVNLCGVPWLHAALADSSSIRIGADVAFSVGEYGFTYVAGAVRNHLARAFGPLSLRSDPDQFWLAPLTPAEVRTALTWQVAGGGTFALGDDLTELSAEQRVLVKAAMKHATPPGAGTPQLPFETAGDALIGSPLMDALESPNEVRTALPAIYIGESVVAMTNWGDDSLTRVVPDTGCKLTSVWGHATEGLLTLRPHDSALYVRTCD